MLSRYFDYAAATPILPAAQKAMAEFYSKEFYNPSALYLDAKRVNQKLQSFRYDIARELGSKPSEIIFTAGGTEANNLAIQGVLTKFKGSKVLYSAIEHESIIQPCEKFNHKAIRVSPSGLIDFDNLSSNIDDDTVLVSIIYANNEIGTIQNISKISQLIKVVRQDRLQRGISLPIYLHSDACQALNYLDINVSRLGVDLLTLNAGKIYGPKQCGALFVKGSTVINPIIYGGGQEKSLRSGTENIANIAGFAQALVTVRSDYKQQNVKLQELQKYLVDNLCATGYGELCGPIIGYRLPNNISITFNNTDNERLVMELDELGFQIATGSACSASKEQSSHVLKAIGLDDKKAYSTIRISMGRYTTLNDVKLLVQNIIKTVAKP